MVQDLQQRRAPRIRARQGEPTRKVQVMLQAGGGLPHFPIGSQEAGVHSHFWRSPKTHFFLVPSATQENSIGKVGQRTISVCRLDA